MLVKWRLVVIPLLLAATIQAWTLSPITPTFAGTGVQRYERAMYYYKGIMGHNYDLTFEVVPKHDKWCAWVTGITDRTVRAGIVYPAPKGCISRPPEYWALHESCHLRMMHVDAALQVSAEEKEREVQRCMVWYGRNR